MRASNTIILLIAALVMTPVFAQHNMQILSEKIKADKKLVVANNMGLTESEAKGFWPVYETYQKGLQKVNERMGNLILNYADAYNKGRCRTPPLTVEESEVKLKRTYAPKLEKVLRKRKVARYIQVENKIRAIVKYEIAAQVPLVE